ncbi:MAG: MBOAT family protein [Bacteroidota bacterium]
MIFNSLAFLVFLPVVIGAYYLLRKARLQNRFLLVASYVFYGWWDWRFLLLIALSTVVDFWVARRIDARREAVGPDAEAGALKKTLRPYLWVSLAVNLGVLSFFKYFNFFSGSAEDLMLSLGMTPDWPTLGVILPVGISFYTFQTLSYTVDVYRGTMRAVDDFFDFALYVSFFPQLVAGPIERAQTLMPQVQQARTFSRSQFTDGAWLILLGFVKKVVIADQLGRIADLGFQTDTPEYGWLGAFLFSACFAFQVYGDFSGYSDIARGTAKLMGFELMINFGKPFLITNPSAFWRHWHISLSTWLRDYLYIPLGGSRGGNTAAYRNLTITMILGGLWHGAGWGFVLWGLYHGVLLSIHRYWSRNVWAKVPWPQGLRIATGKEQIATRGISNGLSHALLVTGFFVFFLSHWMVFRSSTLPEGNSQWTYVVNWLGEWFTSAGIEQATPWLPAFLLFATLAMLAQWKDEAMEHFSTWTPARQGLAIAAALLTIAVFGVFEGTEFFYFQF